MRRTLTCGLLASFTMCALGAQAAPRTFTVNPDFARNKVSFHSEATVESFDGSTRKVQGQVVVDPEAPGSAASAWFQVDLNSLDTGMDLRNQHMRQNHLHTDRWPFTRFEMTQLGGTPTPLKPGQTVRFNASGNFSLHGVNQGRTVPVDVTWFPDGSKEGKAKGEVLHLVCRFDVALKDHQIPRPEFLFMKVAESMQVTVDVWAVAK